MKKFLALILAIIMLLSLCACGKENTVSSSEAVASSNNNYALELSKLLCDYNWKCVDMPWELEFKDDNTGIWKMNEEKTYTWEFSSYLNSMSDYTAMLQHDPEFSENHGVYVASIKEKGQLLLGVDKTDNSYKIYFHGKFWRIKDELQANHPQLKYVIGKWEYKENDSAECDVPFDNITIKEDGSCLVDGRMGNYTLSFDARDDFLKLDIIIEGEHLYCLGYYENSFSIAVWNADYNGPVDMSWVNTTAENKLDITAENFFDYFELTLEADYQEDVFGEIERFNLVQYLSLKEEYKNKIYGCKDLYIEMGGTTKYCPITVNPDDKSYTLGEFEERTFELPLEICEFDNDEYRFTAFGNNYIDVANNIDPENPNGKKVCLFPSTNDITISRFTGTIYTVIE